MDTSKEYTKMCEKAVEIQLMRPTWRHGDLSIRPKQSPPEVFLECENCLMEYDDTSEHYPGEVWLPRQDQLQEMLAVRGFSWLLVTFFQFCQKKLQSHNWLTGEVNSPLNSLEKLWLAFVMSEKFNKIWDGEMWKPM